MAVAASCMFVEACELVLVMISANVGTTKQDRESKAPAKGNVKVDGEPRILGYSQG